MKNKIPKILLSIGGLLLLMMAAPFDAGSAIAQSDSQTPKADLVGASHLRLINRLDRPQDGYCIDIIGTPGNLRLDLPPFAHNCKQRLTTDSAVVFDPKGRIIFVAPSVCVTVAGVNSGALPGTPILLRECDESSPFLEAERLQRFSHREDGRLELIGSGLCLAAGARSGVTYSQADRWRPLFVDNCETVEPNHSRWEYVIPTK